MLATKTISAVFGFTLFASTALPQVVSEVVPSGLEANANNDWLKLFGYQEGTIKALGKGSDAGSGIVSGCRTSLAGANCIGTITWGFNDNLSQGFTNWALYGENRVYRGSSSGITAEFNITSWNLNGAVDVYGNSEPNGVLAVALQLASGGTCGLSPLNGKPTYMCYNPVNKVHDLGRAEIASAALQIVNNGSPFYSGINFSHDSIWGTDGKTGVGNAIQMARGHKIVWQYCGEMHASSAECSASNEGTELYSTVSEAAGKTLLISGDVGFSISNRDLRPMLNVPVRSDFVNGFQLLGGVAEPASHGVVQVQAVGSDVDIDIGLVPQGRGVIDLRGAMVGETCSSTGSLYIKINGTVKRLPYC